MSRIDQLQQMIQEDPNDVFLQYALGLELLNTSVERALIQFEQVITLDETYVPAYYQLGQALVQKTTRRKDWSTSERASNWLYSKRTRRPQENLTKLFFWRKIDAKNI